jgi:2-polyprenyl-6-methoxyphenol hydroxylase-like FAD-dependent oxidoreductase
MEGMIRMRATVIGDVPRGRRRDDTLHSATLMRGRLVAADGIWSTVRELIDPVAPRPEYAGHHHTATRAGRGGAK